MKTLSLKEAQAPYTLTLEETVLAEGPVQVLHSDGEQVIGVLVPPDEYELFSAWQRDQWHERQAHQGHKAFERAMATFERMRPKLLQKYRGRVVAVYDGQVVEVGRPGESVAKVAGRVYDRIGYVQVYVQLVRETPRIYKITGPRLAQR